MGVEIDISYISSLSFFHFSSVLIPNQRIGDKVFDEFHDLGIIYVPIPVVDQTAQTELVSINKLRAARSYKLSQLVNFSATLIANGNFSVMHKSKAITNRFYIIHQLRNSTKYVSYKDIKALVADLKAVYGAVDESAAIDALDSFAEKWDGKYPKIAQSWRDKWPNLSTYFKYPEEVRRLIYTTNAIEGFNRQLRKVTKAKSVFPTDDSLFKMLYLAMMDITKKWTGRRQDWSRIHAQLTVYFDDRMPE